MAAPPHRIQLRRRIEGIVHPVRAQQLLLTLALPTFGLAFAISMITTYGPVVLIELTDSPSQVGALIGGEGAFALVVPLLAGAFSDRLPGPPAARRFPFVLGGAPLVVAGRVVLPQTRAHGRAAAAVGGLLGG
jgi:MFS family permease